MSLIHPPYISAQVGDIYIYIYTTGSQGRRVWTDKMVGRWNPVLAPLANYQVRPSWSTQAAFEVKKTQSLRQRYAERSFCRAESGKQIPPLGSGVPRCVCPLPSAGRRAERPESGRAGRTPRVFSQASETCVLTRKPRLLKENYQFRW